MKEDERKIEFKGAKLSIGRYLFNRTLPEDFRVIDEPVSGKKLKSILNEIALKYTPDIVMETLDRIKDLGFAYSTTEGYTLSLDQLYSEKLEAKILSLDATNMKENMQIINSDQETQNEMKSMPFSPFIESGARGSWDQVKQLVFSRGYVADAKNKIRPDLIRSNLVLGLNEKEFFNSCWGARKGLLDTAISTGVSGYIARQLIYSTNNIELDDDLIDCGTTDTLDINLDIKDDSEFETLGKSLLWRWYVDESGKKVVIDSENYKTLRGKTIKLRSPIYCKSEKMCHVCYGNLHRVLHSNQIGIIGVQAIAERTTQLVLRSFHTSGVASSEINEENIEENQDIISGMSIVNNLFHKPETMSDVKTPSDFVRKLHDVFSQYGSLHHVHFEIIVSAMMRNNGEIWRTMNNRSKIPFEFVSILKLPVANSWLMGCAFSNVKGKLLDGLIKDRSDKCTSITALFRL